MRSRKTSIDPWRAVVEVDNPLTTENVDLYRIGHSPLWAFRQLCPQLIRRYNLHKTRTATDLDAQRVGYLFSILSIKLFKTEKFATDAECEFYYWARENKIHCDEIRSREFVTSGKKEYTVEHPYTNTHLKFFEKITFSRYIAVLEDVGFNLRQPVRTRIPVCRLGV